MDDARVSVSSEAGSHGPASALPSDTPSEGETPQVDEGPSRPHGDELGDALPSEDERGADQDPDATPAPEAAAEVAVDLETLTEKAGKADEYLQLAQRTKADFENYRKRAARDAALAQERGVAKLAKELLPAVDNLDRAMQAVATHGNGEGDDPLVSGIKLVHADVVAALARVGIEPFSPEGEPFDPQHHEAIAQTPVEGAQSGTVVEVYQRGYRLGETILRPARVVVAA